MKNKKTVILLGVIIIALIALLTGHMVTTKNTFSIEPSNNSITEEDRLFGDRLEIKSLTLKERITGTPNFDADNEAGNDSDAENDIVRSFDNITWTLETVIGKKDENDNEKITNGVIQIKATLPVQNIEGSPMVYKWVNSCSGCSDVNVSSDGTELVANHRIVTSEELDSYIRNFSFTLNVLGAPNGLEIQPTFTFSIASTDEPSSITKTLDIVTASAKPAVNITISKSSDLDYLNYFSLLTGNTTTAENDDALYGRMWGYGISLELRSPVDKKFKGIEIPKGKITFDIELNETAVNSGIETSIPNVNPILWDYTKSEYNKSKTKGIMGRNIKWMGTEYSTCHSGFPYNNGNNSKACYNGGNWNIAQDENNKNIYHVTVSNYGISPTLANPTKDMSDRIKYGLDNGRNPFSVYYIETLNPIPEDVNYTQLKVNAKVNNINYTSISGISMNNDYNSNDNEVNSDIKLGTITGSLTKRLLLENSNATEDYKYGDSFLYREQYGVISAELEMSKTNEVYMYGVNKFIKIDGDAIKLLKKDNDSEYESASKFKYNILYAVKKDDCTKNWDNQNEMNNTSMFDEKLKFYDTLEELESNNCKCIGYVGESISGSFVNGKNELNVKYQVKENARIGYVYPFLFDYVLYKIAPNREVNSLLISNTPPANVFRSSINASYRKTSYTENAINAHSSYTNGNSLLIVGAVQKAPIVPTNGSGNNHSIFDLEKNQGIAKFEITPSITNGFSNNLANGIKIKVETTIPDGLTYVPNTISCEDYEIDGNKMTCYFENQEVNQEMEKITFDTLISEDTAHQTTYQLKTLISEIAGANGLIIGNAAPFRRARTTTITVYNLGGASMSKTVLNPILEENEIVQYLIKTSNSTDYDMTDFRLLDILPYNNDGRGTSFNGTYTVSNITYKVISNGVEIQDHNIKLYTSNSDEIKEKNAKNVNMGLFTEVTGNIPEQITGYLLDGTLPKRSKIEVTVTLQTAGNKGSDKYVNSATARISHDPESSLLQTSNAVSEVVNRIISGTVWIDKNGNGLLDDNEQKLKNINVRLLNTNNTELATKTTNEDGYYEFTRLFRGKYKIEIEHDNNYYVTEKNVGSNTSINSKMNEDGISDEITKLDSISHGTIHQEYMNMGIVHPSKLIVNHYIEGTTDPVPLANGQDAPQVITEDKIGASYTTSAVEPLPYYELVETPSNATGEYQEEDTIVDYYYRLRKYPYTVNYYEYKDGSRTTNKISESKEFSDIVYGTKIYATDYVEDEIGIYIYKEWDKEYIEIGASENVINLYYEKKDNQVIVDYVEDGNEDKKLADRELISGKIGDLYETEQKEIPGYKFVRHTNNITGNIGEEVIHVIYYYQKNKYPYTVNYLELGTNKELRTSKKVLEKEYLDVIYSKDEIIEIEKYSYHSFDKEKIEIGIDEKENVINLYYVRNKNKVIVKYIDKDTGKEIEERESSTGEVGSKYTTTKKEIEGYTFTGDSGNTEGEYTDDEIIVIYYYTKVVPEVPVEVDIPQTIDTIFTYVFTIGISIITILISIYYIKRNKKSKK